METRNYELVYANQYYHIRNMCHRFLAYLQGMESHLLCDEASCVLHALPEQLIDKTFDCINLKRNTPMLHESEAVTGCVPHSGVSLHLKPTRRRRNSKDGITTVALQQVRGRICQTAKSTLEYPECHYNRPDEKYT